MIRLALALFSVTLISCSIKNTEVEYPIYRVDDLPQDFRMTSKVWDVTKSIDPTIKDKPIFYGPVQVKFSQKSPGLLNEGNVIYEFASGGGNIDLSQVVSGQKGTFFISFHMPGTDNFTNGRVFFISRSRQRKIEGEVVGSGCKTLLDLSSSLGQLNFKGELKLNTTRDRHISILAGHFVFLTETDKSWIVSQISFNDSKRQDLICPELAPKVSAL
ncbi:MAG: hypothetical protein ACK5W9_11520 [Bdellovibrionales bacterium]